MEDAIELTPLYITASTGERVELDGTNCEIWKGNTSPIDVREKVQDKRSAPQHTGNSDRL